jgi:hypothetical protein
VAAGVLGAVGHLFAAPPAGIYETQAGGEGVGIVDLLDRGYFHVAAVAGILAVLCLLTFAGGWRRWTEQAGVGSVAARALPLGLAASGGAMIFGYGMVGAPLDNVGFVFFQDPDGNGWAVQQISARGRTNA